MMADKLVRKNDAEARSTTRATARRAWDEWNRNGGPLYPHEKVVQFTFRRFPAGCRAGKRVLDLGCGSGVHVLFFAAEGFRVSGSDASEVAIRNTRRLVAAHGYAADLRIEDMASCSYPENTFDYVCSVGALDSAGPNAARAAVREVVRVLVPGGLALLMFASDADSRITDGCTPAIHGFGLAEVEDMLPSHGLAVRWIDRYITTYESNRSRNDEFLITLQKAFH